MKYTPPATRIKITKKVNGDVMYQPQYQILWLRWVWAPMRNHIWDDEEYTNLKEAQERIDKFLVSHDKQYKQDVGGRIDTVEYVKYP